MKKIKLKYSIIILAIFIASIYLFINHQPPIDANNQNLFSYWKGDHEENPGFEITKDYFILDDQKLNYELKNDNITIYYSTFTFTGKFRVDNNTLFIESDGNIDAFRRWCEDINDVCGN